MADLSISEEWRVVSDSPNYEVSNLGRVRTVAATFRTPAGFLLCPFPSRRGYLVVSGPARPGRNRQQFSVHVLVCAAFHGAKPTPRHQAAHWDGNKNNNSAFNLRWATPKENVADMIRHGRKPMGENHPGHILTESAVRAIKHRLTISEYKTKDIAKQYGVSPQVINTIRRGKSWGWLI